MKLTATLAFVMGVASACGGTPDVVTPGTPEPVANATEVATESLTPIVSDKPAGFGETPGAPSVTSTETPVPSVPTERAPGSIYEMFVPPTSSDYARMKASDPEVPTVLAGPESIARKAMENNDVLRDVADQCGIDLTTDTLEVVYFEGTVETQFRWGDYYRAVDSTGAVFTCWPTVKSTGELGQYPAYFNQSTGQLMSSESGIRWVKLPGEVDVFGTTIGLLNETGYIVPGGLTAAEVANPGNWNKLAQSGEVTGTEPSAINSPFSRENMIIANEAGWLWNPETGTLNAPGNNEILQFQEGVLYDSDGNELKVEDLQFLKVNGVDEYGLPMKLILEKTVKDENGEHTEIYVQKSNEWRSTVGYEPGKTSETDIMKWNHITQEDVESGFLRTLILSNQYKWPENSIAPEYSYAFMGGSREGAFKLGLYDMSTRNQYPGLPEGGTLRIAPELLMYRMDLPGSTKQVAIAAELRQTSEGNDIVLISAISDYYLDNNRLDAEFGPNASSFGISYLVALDDRDCSSADLGMGASVGTRVVKDICVFMPPDDPRWDIATWETIANGAEPGSVSESTPLANNDLAKWQDSVMIAISK